MTTLDLDTLLRDTATRWAASGDPELVDTARLVHTFLSLPARERTALVAYGELLARFGDAPSHSPERQATSGDAGTVGGDAGTS